MRLPHSRRWPWLPGRPPPSILRLIGPAPTAYNRPWPDRPSPRIRISHISRNSIRAAHRSVSTGPALRDLLAQREELARKYFAAPAQLRASITRDLDQLDQQMAATEAALADALKAAPPSDGPNYVPPEPIDFVELRASAVRRRRPVYLPVPQPSVLPPLPAPARETLYLEYLTDRAANSPVARHLVDDVSRLFRERRELAFRSFESPADQRGVMDSAIAAVSQRLHAITRSFDEAVALKHW